ncbi:MAG: hypothetical protein KatS3mg014_2433 [Actinomycetota bacterium]|nr:MAG: hypothetical protein KatS3mg014_2433 [Actinomycetota bacterium]
MPGSEEHLAWRSRRDVRLFLEENWGWWRHAACRGMSTEAFFCDRGDWRCAREAQEVCARCPVSTCCLVYGMCERYGVWGGLTFRERRQLIPVWQRHGPVGLAMALRQRLDRLVHHSA